MSALPLGEDDLADILGELDAAAPEAPFLAEPTAEIAPPPEAASADAPQRFTFGQGPATDERLTVLERMGDKLAASLKAVVEPFSRSNVKAAPQAIEIRSFGSWQAACPAFTSLSLYWMRPLKGGLLVAVEPQFVAGLVESFYGGGSAHKRPFKAVEFSASEGMLLKRLLDRVTEALAHHWRDLAPVEPTLAARETSIGHLGFLRPEEMVAVQKFALTGDPVHTTLQFVYPLAMIRPLEARAAVKVRDDDTTGNDLWRMRLAEAVAEVRLPVRSVLARPEISVAQLLALKPGDVIPIQLAPRTPLLAGQRRIADGVIGEQDGRAALMIERVGASVK